MKSTIIAIFVFVLFVATAAAQKTPDPADGFYEMTKAAPHAFNKGEHERATTLAQQLLQEAPRWQKNWNHGNAIHVGNLVLGRVALANGDVEKAGKFLLDAGRTPGSPQLNSFGPDMLFASEMLRAGAANVVLQYLDLCEKFWVKKGDRISVWKAQIEKNETPDFGANIRYHF